MPFVQDVTDQGSFNMETLRRQLAERAGEKPVFNYRLLFTSLVALYCAWVFSLPLFPTQDGAVHLYYVDVIRHLLSGHSQFDSFYYLRHPLPPYLVHYAGLFLLTMFMDPVTAEKCVVCAILISTAFGFRYLACGIGGNGRLTSLFIMPIALSWPLFMGFHNFCLALSFSLWGWGFWVRIMRNPTLWLCTAFLAAIILIVFTHPVPLLFLLAVIGLDTVLRIMQMVIQGAGWARALGTFRRQIGLASLAYSSLFYIALFVDKTSAAHDLTQSGSRLRVASGFFRLEYMSFATGGPFTKLARCGLVLLLIFSITVAFRSARQAWKRQKLGNSAVMLLCALALVILIPLLPPNMNGSEHFSDRLSMLIWISALAAASESWITTKYRKRVTAAAAAACAIFNLALANQVIRPVAAEISGIESIAVEHRQAGLLFDSPLQIGIGRLTFGPYLRWAGARYFRRAGAVIINDPWCSPPYPLPLRRSHNSVTEKFSAREFEDPVTLHNRLLGSVAYRDRLLSSVDLIVFVGKHNWGTVVPDPLIAADQAHQWKCRNTTWYSICEVEGASR